MGIDIGGPPLISCNTLTYKMIGDALTLLLQSGVRDRGISQNRLVVTFDIGWARHRDSHHTELVPQAS